jgi:hypothetical protein
MSLIMCQDGDTLLVNELIGAVLTSNYIMHLFQNNVTPAQTDTLKAYTEADFGGYVAGQTMHTWGAATIVSSHAVSSAAQLTWTRDTSAKTNPAVNNNIYGYYVTESTNALLVFAERDPSAPIAMNTNAQTYKVTPGFSLISEF